MSPPLLCIHLWCLEAATIVVYRCNPPRTAREINTSHSKSNQPSQQELSAFHTAGGSIVPRHSTSNYPSTSKRNQQSSPSKRNKPLHSRCKEPLPSKRIQSSFTVDSYSQLSCHPATTGVSTTIGQNRGWPPSFCNDAATISPLHGPRIPRGCVDIDYTVCHHLISRNPSQTRRP